MTKTAMAYLDESGDLGWKLNQPYLHGGSSRFFVIAIAIGLNNSFRRFGKVVDKLHQLQKWTSPKEMGNYQRGCSTEFLPTCSCRTFR